MAALPPAPPDTDRRWVLRVAPDPYVRFDTCDYSLDPDFVGRRIEIRISDRESTFRPALTRPPQVPDVLRGSRRSIWCSCLLRRSLEHAAIAS